MEDFKVYQASGYLTKLVADASDVRKTYEEISGSMVQFDAPLSAPIESLIADINPVQELHGQDAPYPAGGGVNKNNISAWTTGELNVANGTVTENSNKSVSPYIFLESGTYTISRLARSTGNWIKACFYDSEKTFENQLFDNTNLTNTFTIASDGYIRIGTDYVAEESDHIQLESGNFATPYKPYSNICPITGWTGCEVNVTGVNLWDEEWEVGDINTTGEKSPASDRYRSKNYISIKGDTTYYFYLGHSNWNNLRNYYYDEDYSFIKASSWFSGNTSFATPPNARYMMFKEIVTPASYAGDISINYPSTDTDYHAYSGTTLSVTFPDGQTMYGGTYDFVSGVGVADETTISITEDMIYNYNASRNAFMVLNTSLPESLRWEAVTSNGSTVKFSHGEIVQRNDGFANVTNGACCGSTFAGNGGILFVKLANNFSDLATAKAYVTEQYNNGTPLQVTYKLATPTEIQLTPQEINTLIGVNNIWADTGDVSVKYRTH